MSREAEIDTPSAPSARWLLITVALANMLAPLNSTMIGVALPTITEQFGADLQQSSWLVIAYLIAMASLQPVTGKLGDRFGHRRFVLGGLLYFAIACMGAATATSLMWLLFFRVQQAVAAAIALPNGTALLRRSIPSAQLGSRIGMVGSIVVLAAAAGPPIGGVLTEWVGWRAIFAVNLVIIAPALVIGWRVLPTTKGRASDTPFDLLGAALLLGLLAGAAFLLTWKGERGALWFSGVGAIAALAFFFFQRAHGHADPVFQPRLFKNSSFAAANAAVLLGNMAMYTTFLTIPLFLAERPSWGAAAAGSLLAALWVPTVFCAPLGGYLSDRWGRRRPANIGLALLAVGLFTLFGIGEEIALHYMVGGLAVAGIGLGFSGASMRTAAIESVEKSETGMAAGLYSTSRYIGSVIGASLLPLLYGTGGFAGFSRVLWLVVGAALLALLSSFGILKYARSERMEK